MFVPLEIGRFKLTCTTLVVGFVSPVRTGILMMISAVPSPPSDARLDMMICVACRVCI